ncbi:hypothetical protein LXL04_019272 [Taraxacum kok-saghyz]
MKSRCVCSSFRPVSEISAHCSHLWASSHLVWDERFPSFQDVEASGRYVIDYISSNSFDYNEKLRSNEKNTNLDRNVHTDKEDGRFDLANQRSIGCIDPCTLQTKMIWNVSTTAAAVTVTVTNSTKNNVGVNHFKSCRLGV